MIPPNDAPTTSPDLALLEQPIPPHALPRPVLAMLVAQVASCTHGNTIPRRPPGHAVIRGGMFCCAICGAIELEPGLWRPTALHARLAELAALPAPPAAEAEAATAAEPGVWAMRLLPIGFISPERIEPGATVAIEVQPQVIFRGEVFRISQRVGDAFDVVDLQVERVVKEDADRPPVDDAPSEEEDAEARSQMDKTIAFFQGRRAELDKPYAERSDDEKRYGGRRRRTTFESQLGANGHLPASGLSRFQCDTVEPGHRMRLTVKNVSETPAHFRAALEGTVIE